MRRRIAVVGGGPGGLSFARVLHRHGHPVTVLERDPGPDARPPGGTLDLHEGMGQLALEKAGLLAEFRALSRPEGQAMRILDTDGTVLRDWPPRPDDRANPEIDRGQLRDLLLGPLDVRWGWEVTRVVPGGRDGVRVHCADGRQETFDLVVGADGAWSRVRPALSPVTPHHTGVTSVETSLDDVGTRHPDLARLVGAGSMAVYGVNRALVAQRNSGGHVKVYAQFRAPLERTDLDLALADVEEARSSLLALFDGWAAPVLDLLRHGTEFVPRPLYTLPVSHTWPHVPGVTLLGDAAHLMPPLGAGANLAMLDGTDLAESLTTDPTDLTETIHAFEQRMWARANKWARITTTGLKRLVGPDPGEALALFDGVQGG
ncbi:FAD-dependent oxidoreductase [Streptomyces sp. NPDC091279]|uniref:FAD-dependent oxidoreductase n=1 Tax=Streptomyces sp. NPDC091279 TaxID=3365983 RepID=UPI00381100A3